MKWTLFTLRLADAGSADVSSANLAKHALPLDLVPKVIFALSADREIGTEPLAVAIGCLIPSLELMRIVNPLATASGSVTQLL